MRWSSCGLSLSLKDRLFYTFGLLQFPKNLGSHKAYDDFCWKLLKGNATVFRLLEFGAESVACGIYPASKRTNQIIKAVRSRPPRAAVVWGRVAHKTKFYKKVVFYDYFSAWLFWL